MHTAMIGFEFPEPATKVPLLDERLPIEAKSHPVVKTAAVLLSAQQIAERVCA